MSSRTRRHLHAVPDLPLDGVRLDDLNLDDDDRDDGCLGGPDDGGRPAGAPALRSAPAVTGPVRPWLFLDVDGVINVDLPSWPGPLSRHTLTVPRQDGLALELTVTWSPQLIAALTDLDVDVLWLTTWGQAAPQLLGPVLGAFSDAPALPVRRKLTDHYGKWKADAVRAQVTADPRPFIWIDDEATFHYGSTLRDLNCRQLNVITDPAVGATPADLGRIRAFLAATAR